MLQYNGERQRETKNGERDRKTERERERHSDKVTFTVRQGVWRQVKKDRIETNH